MKRWIVPVSVLNRYWGAVLYVGPREDAQAAKDAAVLALSTLGETLEVDASRFVVHEPETLDDA